MRVSSLSNLPPENAVAEQVIGAAIEVHRILGPGLFEMPYEQALSRELQLRDVAHQRQLLLPVVYKGMELGDAYRLDLLVCNLVVVEIKALDALLPIHEAQVLTYLRITGKRVGLLLNFHAPLLKQGIRRIINSTAHKPGAFSQ